MGRSGPKDKNVAFSVEADEDKSLPVDIFFKLDKNLNSHEEHTEISFCYYCRLIGFPYRLLFRRGKNKIKDTPFPRGIRREVLNTDSQISREL
jgi:hypothetical protein